jgi:hypothetical protein
VHSPGTAVGTPQRLRGRFDAELAFQRRAALVVGAPCAGPVAVRGGQPDQQPVRRLCQWVQAEQPFGVREGFGGVAGRFAQLGQLLQRDGQRCSSR